MNSQYSGAKLVRKEIEKFHLILNHEEMIPAQCYRMSDMLYGLICFTNQIVALFVSKNYQMIPVFMNRVLERLKIVKNKPGIMGYSNLVYDYLCNITHYLNKYSDLDEEWFSHCIPQELLVPEVKKAPEYEHETMTIRLPENWIIESSLSSTTRKNIKSPLLGKKLDRKEIEKFHLLLNHEDMIPVQCYRRSNCSSNLVNFTNQIVALFLSKNYQRIPDFIRRVKKELDQVKSQPCTMCYRTLVYDYLCQMTYYLDRYCSLDEDWLKERVPKEFFDSGVKKAPEYDHKRMVIKLAKNWIPMR